MLQEAPCAALPEPQVSRLEEEGLAGWAVWPEEGFFPVAPFPALGTSRLPGLIPNSQLPGDTAERSLSKQPSYLSLPAMGKARRHDTLLTLPLSLRNPGKSGPLEGPQCPHL